MAPISGSPSVTGPDDWVNATLTANVSGVSGTGTPSYKWLRNGVAITGATASTYTVIDADRTKDITVTVEYSLLSGAATGAAFPIRDLTGIYNQTQLEAIRTPNANLAKTISLLTSRVRPPLHLGVQRTRRVALF